MNISSIVVSVLDKNSSSVISKIKKSDFCKFHLYEKGKVIITIEGADVSEEMKKLLQVEAIQGVIAANMVFSYCEEELEQERNKLSASNDYPQWLNTDNMNAKDIPYHGSIDKNLV